MIKIEIYTRNACAFCDRAKIFFKSKGLSFIEYNVHENSDYLKEMLKKSNGKKTMPQIFIDDFHVGGFDDLKETINKGKALLQAIEMAENGL